MPGRQSVNRASTHTYTHCSGPAQVSDCKRNESQPLVSPFQIFLTLESIKQSNSAPGSHDINACAQVARLFEHDTFESIVLRIWMVLQTTILANYMTNSVPCSFLLL